MAHDSHSHKSHGFPPHIRLFSLLKPEKADIGLLVCFSIISGILYLATPLAVDAVVQNIAFGGQQQVYLQTLLIFSFALLVFLALLSVVSATQHYVSELIQQRIFVRLSADMSFRLPRLKMDAFEKYKTHELVNRFLDVTTVQKSSATILLDGVNVILSTFIGLMVLAFYHPFLLAFDLILVLGLIFILFPLGKNGIATSIKESYAKHAVAGWFEQLVAFPILFKSPGGKDLSVEHTNHLVNDYITQRNAHYRILIRQILGLLALQAIASASLLVIGGALVLSGELTLGQLVASELIVSVIVSALVSLGKHIETWYDALAAIDKLGSLVDLPIEKLSGQSVSTSDHALSIQIQNLTFQFDDDEKPVFKNLNLTVNPGEKLCLTGPMGAGTGTLLQLIYGLRRPNEGFIQINDLDLRQWNLESLRNNITLLREVEIIEGSIFHNIRLGKEDIPYETVQHALEQVGLHSKLMDLPDGLDTHLDFGGRPLSDSQRIRLCVARALVHNPKILLIDKLLDGLDHVESEKLFQTLFQIKADWTMIVATRDRNIFDYSHRVISMDQISQG